MVELQPSKLVMGVRFPSPAPIQRAARGPGTLSRGTEPGPRYRARPRLCRRTPTSNSRSPVQASRHRTSRCPLEILDPWPRETVQALTPAPGDELTNPGGRGDPIRSHELIALVVVFMSVDDEVCAGGVKVGPQGLDRGVIVVTAAGTRVEQRVMPVGENARARRH